MSAGVVFSQMLIIFAMMLIGLFLTKKGIISQSASKEYSALVINVCAPMQMIVSVLNQEGNTTSKMTLLKFFLLSLFSYVILILLGFVLNKVLRTDRKISGDYHLMTVFGNTGFIGIPVANALLGPQSLIYVAVYNLCYNIFMFTYGLWIITADIEGVTMKERLQRFINPGTISCIVTIIIFWFDIKVPDQIASLCNYAGTPATLLSLVVVGMSLAAMTPKDFFGDIRLFIFTFLRFVVFPIAFIVAMKPFIASALIRGTMALMIAVPVGNMPAMLRAQYEQDDSLVVKGAIVTTTLSVLTITIVCLFV